jgi:hypothetical protein
MSSPTLWVGITTPFQLQLTVEAANTVPDTSVVTAASIVAKAPSGTTSLLSASLSDQDTESVQVNHTWGGSEIDEEGQWEFLVNLTTPSGTIPCDVYTDLAVTLPTYLGS